MYYKHLQSLFIYLTKHKTFQAPQALLKDVIVATLSHLKLRYSFALNSMKSESEDISEVNTFVVDTLGLETHFDISIAQNAVSEMWNEFWCQYQDGPY